MCLSLDSFRYLSENLPEEVEVKTFGWYLGSTIVKPRSTFTVLNTDPKGLLQGTRAIFLIGVLYTLTVAGLAAAGAEISSPAWLAIPHRVAVEPALGVWVSGKVQQ